MELIKVTGEELDNYATDFWHRSDWVNYCVNSSFEKGEDLSVVAREKDKLIAVIPLIREGDEFTFQRNFGPSITYFEDINVLGKVADELVRYAYKNDVRRIAITGYVPTFLYGVRQECVSHLRRNDIRKSYKSLMNNKSLTSNVVNCDTDRQTIDNWVDTVKTLYYNVAKKVTRPSETFEMFKDWIANGVASLIIAHNSDILVGFTLVTHYNREAYYFMSAVIEEYKHMNVSHFMQGVAFEVLKGRNVFLYNLGDTSVNNLLGCPNEKEKGIAFFKSGWGHISYNVVSEYFLDKDYMVKKHIERIENYVGAEYYEKCIILPETRTE